MPRPDPTPAARAKQRKHDPAISKPPPVIKGDRRDAVKTLALDVAGRTFPIAEHLDGQTPWEMGMDQGATITVPIRDPSGSMIEVFTDESMLQQDGVRCRVNGVTYVVQGFDHSDGLYTLTLIDEVVWRLQQFTKFIAKSRAAITRFGFIQSLVDEASRAPLARMRSFIPEIDDKQRILPSKPDSTA